MQPSPVSPRPELLLALAVLVAAAAFAVGGAGGYAAYEHRKAEAAIQGQQQLATQLQQTRAQIDQLSSRVSELVARPAPEAVAPPPVAQPPVAVKPATPRGPSESQRLKKMQSQLDRQGKAIDQQNKAIVDTQSQLDTTRGDLSKTRTELSGSIARTHDELVLLQKKVCAVTTSSTSRNRNRSNTRVHWCAIAQGKFQAPVRRPGFDRRRPDGHAEAREPLSASDVLHTRQPATGGTGDQQHKQRPDSRVRQRSEIPAVAAGVGGGRERLKFIAARGVET